MSTYIRAVVAAMAIADKYGIPLVDLADTFADIPAVDVAPVVRCKDCRWRGREECAMFYRCECGEQHTWETDNDFCSYGEGIDT